MKRKKQGLQSFVDSLEKKVEKYCDKAEKDHCTESMIKLISDLALSFEELEKDKNSV